MSWYKTGSIAATNGSRIITGAGTQFTNPLNGVSSGRMLLLPGAGAVQIYEIESVQSDTQLTLVSAFSSTTGSGKSYAIPTSPSVSLEQFAHEFASTLAYYQQQLQGWQSILTGSGNITLTTPDGQSVTVRSQTEWDRLLDTKMGAGQFGWGDEAQMLPDNTNLLDYFSGDSVRAGLYKCLYPVGGPVGAEGFVLLWNKYSNTYGVLTAANIVASTPVDVWHIKMSHNVWDTGWSKTWTDKNLDPATRNTNQVIQALKTHRAEWASLILSPETQGGASYLQGSELDGSTRWTLGQASQHTNDVTWWGSKVNTGVTLTAAGVNVTPALMVNGKSVLTVDSVAPPRQLTTSAINNATQGVRIRLKFIYTGGGTNALFRISGGSGYNGQINQQWVATLQVRSGNVHGDGAFTAILNTDFGNNPINYVILIVDPNDVNAVFVHFQYGTPYPGDTSISLVDKLFIDLSQSDIGGTIVNLGDIPQAGRLPVSIIRSWTTLNTTVDGNGNIKSASPIVKLFADGSSELNAESEGIVTTRLSEGVYHITGCLGLNADRAWGGDDGGITNPKCRNGYERIWNDYEVQEDGSLIIRTYHRVHSDAMPFAQNRLNRGHRPYDEKRDSEEWVDRSPIDIPLGTYLTVRVQMPAREEDHYAPSSIRAVSHSNVYCNSVSPV